MNVGDGVVLKGVPPIAIFDRIRSLSEERERSCLEECSFGYQKSEDAPLIWCHRLLFFFSYFICQTLPMMRYSSHLCFSNNVLSVLIFTLLSFLTPRTSHAFLQLHRLPHDPSSSYQTQQYSQLDKGFNLLEIGSKVVPQGRIVQTAKESWKFIWKVSMNET
jgi:hypothetical protein